MRRSSGDERWSRVRDEVRRRDRGRDRILRCLSPVEAVTLMRNAGSMMSVLDPAHYMSVQSRPDLCYEVDNICLLNHYSHTMLDDFRNPVTGARIDAAGVEEWWDRILRTDPVQYGRIRALEGTNSYREEHDDEEVPES